MIAKLCFVPVIALLFLITATTASAISKDSSANKRFHFTSVALGNNPLALMGYFPCVELFAILKTNKKLMNRIGLYAGTQNTGKVSNFIIGIQLFDRIYSGNWYGFEVSANILKDRSGKLSSYAGLFACKSSVSGIEIYRWGNPEYAQFKKYSRSLFATAHVEYAYTGFLTFGVSYRLPLAYGEPYGFSISNSNIPVTYKRPEKFYPNFTKADAGWFNMFQVNVEFTFLVAKK